MVKRWLMAACLAGCLGLPAGAEELPRRVLSMNLCTDQLAMLVAAPGQLISVSAMSQDPRGSVMAEEAMQYHGNRGLAEDIFLMQPDLVLAGSFSTTATVQLLRRLGQRVEVFEPEYSFDDMRANLRRMGALLGRDVRARQVIAQFDADLAALGTVNGPRPRAATYGTNGYSAGPNSLAGEIVQAAGLDNIGAELGLGIGAALPLELLMLSDPDLVITGRPYPGASRADEILSHPGLLALKEKSPVSPLSDRDWVCGTPLVLRAVSQLRAARDAL